MITDRIGLHSVILPLEIGFCPGVLVHKGITIVLSLFRSHWLAVVYCLVLCRGSCEPVHEDRTRNRHQKALPTCVKIRHHNGSHCKKVRLDFTLYGTWYSKKDLTRADFAEFLATRCFATKLKYNLKKSAIS